jgi:hypothetical protein
LWLCFLTVLCARLRPVVHRLMGYRLVKFDYKKGFEIETERKNVICELYGFRENSTKQLIKWYKLGKSIIHCVLRYNTTKQACLTRTKRPPKLSDANLNKVIEYCSKK